MKVGRGAASHHHVAWKQLGKGSPGKVMGCCRGSPESRPRGGSAGSTAAFLGLGSPAAVIRSPLKTPKGVFRTPGKKGWSSPKLGLASSGVAPVPTTPGGCGPGAASSFAFLLGTPGPHRPQPDPGSPSLHPFVPSPLHHQTQQQAGGGGGTPAPMHGTPDNRMIRWVRTPKRPSIRQLRRDLDEDIAAALQEGSVALLKASLLRRHHCAQEHPIHEAVQLGYLGALQLLLDQGGTSGGVPDTLDLNLPCGGRFPLHCAIACAAHAGVSLGSGSPLAQTRRKGPGWERLAILELLLKYGADVEASRGDVPEGNKALHEATKQAGTQIAELLLDYKADPNARNAIGQSPLHTAVTGCAAARVYGAGAGKKMVELLLERGANPLMRDSVGRLARQLTRDLGIQEVLGKAELWWRRRPVFWIRCKGNERSVFNWLLQEHLEAVASFL